MGAGQSAEEDDVGLNLAQPVVPLDAAGPITMHSRSVSQETRKALPVKNPFMVKFDETLLRPSSSRGQTQIDLRYSADLPCKITIFRHASPAGVDVLSECSTPESVPADWDLAQMQNVEPGVDLSLTIPIGHLTPEDADFHIILLNVTAHAPNSKWTQWYYLRFEPFRSGEAGTYILTQWEEKMQIGKKVYSIMKIYSTKDELEEAPPTCLICSTEACNIMVLPCRHLCLCAECATAIRSRDQRCPICRSSINSLLQIDATRNSTSMDQLKEEPQDRNEEQHTTTPPEEQ